MDSMVNHMTRRASGEKEERLFTRRQPRPASGSATIPYARDAVKPLPMYDHRPAGRSIRCGAFTHYDYWQDKVRPSIALMPSATSSSSAWRTAIRVDCQTLAAGESIKSIRTCRHRLRLGGERIGAAEAVN